MRLRDLQAAACVALMLSSAVAQTPASATGQNPRTADAGGATAGGTVNPTAPAQAQSVQNDTTGTPGLPQAPQPKLTEPLDLRPSGKDYTRADSVLAESVQGLYGDELSGAAAEQHA